MDKLKPCPFCGNEAKDANTGVVYCSFCSARVSHDTPEEARTAWNRRADAPKPGVVPEHSAPGPDDLATREAVRHVLSWRVENLNSAESMRLQGSMMEDWYMAHVKVHDTILYALHQYKPVMHDRMRQTVIDEIGRKLGGLFGSRQLTDEELTYIEQVLRSAARPVEPATVRDDPKIDIQFLHDALYAIRVQYAQLETDEDFRDEVLAIADAALAMLDPPIKAGQLPTAGNTGGKNG